MDSLSSVCAQVYIYYFRDSLIFSVIAWTRSTTGLSVSIGFSPRSIALQILESIGSEPKSLKSFSSQNPFTPVSVGRKISDFLSHLGHTKPAMFSTTPIMLRSTEVDFQKKMAEPFITLNLFYKIQAVFWRLKVQLLKALLLRLLHWYQHLWVKMLFPYVHR